MIEIYSIYRNVIVYPTYYLNTDYDLNLVSSSTSSFPFSSPLCILFGRAGWNEPRDRWGSGSVFLMTCGAEGERERMTFCALVTKRSQAWFPWQLGCFDIITASCSIKPCVLERETQRENERGRGRERVKLNWGRERDTWALETSTSFDRLVECWLN